MHRSKTPFQQAICVRKVGYPTIEFAEKGAAATGMRVYECQCCGFWHLTTRGSEREFKAGAVHLRIERLIDLTGAANKTRRDIEEIRRHRAFLRVLKEALLAKAERDRGKALAAVAQAPPRP